MHLPVLGIARDRLALAAIHYSGAIKRGLPDSRHFTACVSDVGRDGLARANPGVASSFSAIAHR
jgi:hypothetical protein